MKTNPTKPEAIIFDMDGTLFKSESVLIPAFGKVFATLRAERLYAGETPPVSRMLEMLGMLLDDIWEHVVPGVSAAWKERANELLLEYQLESLRQGLGRLYPGVEETLRELHGQGFKLFVASNGLQEYIAGIVDAFGLGRLFAGLYSAGKYGTASKAELVRLLLEEHAVRSAWMVGDRSSDVEAGRKNNLFVIGCGYADFGKAHELNDCDRLIHDFRELLQLTACI